MLLLPFILAGAGFVLQRRATGQALERHAAPGRLVDARGHRLHLQCSGSGSPAVILDSGMGAASFEWTYVYNALRHRTRVCRYDRAGYGWSEPSSAPRTSLNIADELHALLSNAGERPPFVLAGHSFGGINMRVYASRYPLEAAGLVLLDSMDESSRIAKLELARMFLVRLTAPLGLPRLLRRLIVLKNLPADEQIAADAMRARTPAYEAAYREVTSLPQSIVDLQANRLALGLPLIVLSRTPKAGDRGDAGHLERQRRLAGLTSRGQLEVARNSGHYVQIHEPESVVAAVMKLVEMARRR